MKKALNRKPRKATILEYSGDWIAQNFWLKIGLSKDQLALVTRLAREYGFKQMPAASCARQLIMLALANLPTTEATLNSVARYAEAEGLSLQKALDARATATINSMPPAKGGAR